MPIPASRNDPEKIRAALAFAADRAADYVTSVRARRVSPSTEAVATLERFHELMPDTACDARDVIALLDEVGSPATVASAGGRYFGFVIGGSLPAVTAASWLASTWDQNAAMRVMSPVAAELEDVVLVARAGWNVEDDGLAGAPAVEMVVGEEVHASVQKALSLGGFGRRRVTVVEADEQGRMRTKKLPGLSERSIVCIQAGNVNTGAFDPATEICERAREAGAWVHVDGAFGLWAGISPKYRELTAGFEKADSWATDAHKWLNVSYDSGIVMVRDAMALRRAMTISAAYLMPGAMREPMNHVPEASRKARGVELWAALKSLGRSGLRDLVERTCALASRFAARIKDAGFEVLNDVVINQVLASFGTAEKTLEVIRRVQEDGTCWCGGTVWQGKTAMRISVSSWATTEEDIERSADAVIRLARQ